MPPLVRAALLLMVAALTLYSLGVWAEHWAGRLKPWHLTCFWCGLVCDATGTDLMRRVAGAFHFSLHSVTGAVALLLMLAHALWASLVLRRRDERALRVFHRVSVTVWTIWLVPFVSGLVLGRQAAHHTATLGDPARSIAVQGLTTAGYRVRAVHRRSVRARAREVSPREIRSR